MSRANEPAYPVTPTDRSGQIGETRYGITLREHFAAMAMQGCLALPSEHRTPQVIATEAVMMADALIAELAKPKEYPLDEYGHQVRP